MHDATTSGQPWPVGPTPDRESDAELRRDPVALAAADVKAMLAGALGLRRVVELAAESLAPEAARPDE